jgi:C1A family cysteine protease
MSVFRDASKPFGCIPAGVKLSAKLDTELETLESKVYTDLFKGLAKLRFLPLLELIPLSLKFPPALDLKVGNPLWPPVQNQGQLGSCVENAVTTCLADVEAKETGQLLQLSRLFLYWLARLDKSKDTGSTGAAAAFAARFWGAPLESVWPYDPMQFAVKPPQAAYDDASKRKLTDSFYTLSLEHILHSLNQGYPISFGTVLFSSFSTMSDANGWVCPLPTDTDTILGGHFLVIRGYDLAKRLFLIQNSWGTGWGLGNAPGSDPNLQGCFWMSFDHVASVVLCNSWRTFRKVANT